MFEPSEELLIIINEAEPTLEDLSSGTTKPCASPQAGRLGCPWSAQGHCSFGEKPSEHMAASA